MTTSNAKVSHLTVAEATRSGAFLNQIVSYAALANAHGIDGAPDRARVDRVGLYFSRYALLESWPLRDLISEEAEARLLALLLDAGGAPGG
ncbi:MAG: hypothetical protein KC549_16340 [Myxococcales bacterium]|nr:hypothetical protein [Myxococcales bacterium]